MDPRIDVITLAVGNLERSLHFYRDGLGLPTDGVVGTEFAGSTETPAGAVVMFQLAGELTLALYPRTELAKDAHLPPSAVTGAGFGLGHAVESREAVDDLLAQAARAGGRVTARAHERPWGIYSGYVTDPDGHLWEIIHFLGASAPS